MFRLVHLNLNISLVYMVLTLNYVLWKKIYVDSATTFLSSKMEQRIQYIIGKAWFKVWLPFLKNSERQAQTFYSPFTFTAQRHKESNYINRLFLSFEIWGRMTWSIPVSKIQEAEFFQILPVKGSESCSIHAFLGIGSS